MPLLSPKRYQRKISRTSSFTPLNTPLKREASKEEKRKLKSGGNALFTKFAAPSDNDFFGGDEMGSMAEGEPREWRYLSLKCK